MKAVILAAGKGTRMGDLTKDTPKPLLKIEDKTLLEWKIDVLPAECTEVILIVSYLGDKIREHFGGEYKGRKITFVEAEPLGTGFALFAAKKHLDEPFIVMMGDDLYSRKDIEECLRHPLAALVHTTSEPVSGGKIALTLDGQYIEDIVEGKHEGETMIATGLYVLTPDLFNLPLVKVNNGDEFGLPQTLLQMKEEGIHVVCATAWYQVTKPKDLTPSAETLKNFA